MTNYWILGIGIFLVIGVWSLVLASVSLASSPFDIEFPIPELGNCADQALCKAYCDDLANKDACLEFAKKHGLATPAETEQAKRLPPVGPGGCSSESECRAYCDDVSHAEECLQFAETHGLVSQEEIRRSREFLSQTGPGGCRGANECRAYCEDPAHQEECLEFAHRKGLISDRDAEVARRVLAEGGPGGCRSERECRAYCEDPAHLDQCLAFAERHGFVSKDDALRIKKAGFTAGPGGCKGEAACREFCENPTNQPVCIDWAVENGFMTREEAERAKKFIGRTGPGGCRGEECREFCENPENVEVCLDFAAREGLLPLAELEQARKFARVVAEGGPGGCRGIACRNYCEDPAHQDECFEFAKAQGLVPPEAGQQFEAGKRIREKMLASGGPGGCRSDGECRAYCTDPAHVEECVAFGAAHGGVPPEEVRKMLKEFTEQRFRAHGAFAPQEDFRRFEEEARRRFEEFRQLEEHFRGEFPGAPGEFPGGPPAGGGFIGPGGCTSPAECIQYCSEHKEACFSFGPPGVPEARPPEGGIPPGHDVPRVRRDVTRVLDVPREAFERCVSEILGADAELARRDPEAYFTRKRDAVLTCEERLRESLPKPPGGFPQPGEFPPPGGGTPELCPLMPTVDTCPAGQMKVATFSSPECGTYYTCVFESRTSSPPPPQEDPAAICAAKGGTWDGQTCRFETAPPSPPPTSTQDPTTLCAREGGTWNGSTCIFPTPLPRGALDRLRSGMAVIGDALINFLR